MVPFKGDMGALRSPTPSGPATSVAENLGGWTDRTVQGRHGSAPKPDPVGPGDECRRKPGWVPYERVHREGRLGPW
jgi:hypothetical protein